MQDGWGSSKALCLEGLRDEVLLPYPIPGFLACTRTSCHPGCSQGTPQSPGKILSSKGAAALPSTLQKHRAVMKSGQVPGEHTLSFHLDTKPSVTTQIAPLPPSNSFVQTMLHEHYEIESLPKALPKGSLNSRSFSSAQGAALSHTRPPELLFVETHVSFFLLDVYKQFNQLFHCSSEKFNSSVPYNSPFPPFGVLRVLSWEMGT